MNLGLEHKVALVTAASRGLGFSVARELLREGARVMLSGSSATNLEQAASDLKRDGLSSFTTHQADLGNYEEIQSLVAATVEKSGGVDLLFTNCGGPPAGASLELTDAQWQRGFETIFLSVVRLCRLCVPHMTKRGGGAILALTSSTVKQPIPNLTLSNALRPAIVGFCKTLSNEVASQNIRVNVIAPGRVLTARTQELDEAFAARAGKSVEDIRRKSEEEIPAHRLGHVDEFAAAAAFLLSEKASYITGEILQVDGGLVKGMW
ncbi:MAG: SDR family oxidoreductase [bacterium]